jgi:hypothetical protein
MLTDTSKTNRETAAGNIPDGWARRVPRAQKRLDARKGRCAWLFGDRARAVLHSLARTLSRTRISIKNVLRLVAPVDIASRLPARGVALLYNLPRSGATIEQMRNPVEYKNFLSGRGLYTPL